MSTTSELTWGRLHVDLTTIESGRQVQHASPLVRIIGYTASEQARYMTLTKSELVQLLVDASSALSIVEQQERRRLAKDSVESLRRAEWERRQ